SAPLPPARARADRPRPSRALRDRRRRHPPREDPHDPRPRPPPPGARGRGDVHRRPEGPRRRPPPHARRDVGTLPARGAARVTGRRGAVLAPALVAPAAAAAGPTAAVGSRVWAERCSGCHGDDGRGDGPAAAALVPPPRNFRDAAFWAGRAAEQIRA